MLTEKQISSCRPGLKQLQQPILPLVRLVWMLYLSGPFQTLDELLRELNEPVETGGVRYQDPCRLLSGFLEAMRPFERLKNAQPPARIILEENLAPADQLAALDSWVSQNVLTQELEAINSALCGPCGCTLCCTGPTENMSHEFFEIPLLENEADLFDLARIDTKQSRSAAPDDEVPLKLNGKPFFACPSQLYNWSKGWSMILPKQSSCPNLEPTSGGCTIYPKRPDVCRRPQIFSYILEPEPCMDAEYEGRILPAFVIRRKILAIWDCPYVKQFQEEIGNYAQLCEMEPIFKENKS